MLPFERQRGALHDTDHRPAASVLRRRVVAPFRDAPTAFISFSPLFAEACEREPRLAPAKQYRTTFDNMVIGVEMKRFDTF